MSTLLQLQRKAPAGQSGRDLAGDWHVGPRGDPWATPVAGLVHRALSSPGRPLGGTTRSLMESRFGHDFSHVRIHTDSLAAASARAVNASAYAVGRDIVFAPGQFAPETTEGRRLLAHELTHTLQQRGQGYAATQPDRLTLEPAGSRAETEADSVARTLFPSGPGALQGMPAIGQRLAPSLARNLAPKVSEEVNTKVEETLVTGKNKTQKYSWNAKYSVYMYEDAIVIEVRIKLKGKVSDKTKKAWLAGIESKWNNKYRFANEKRKVSLSFWAVFTDLNPHAVVDVVSKPKSRGDWDMGTWDAGDGEGDTQGDAASHEFGHMIGNKDEYNLPDGKGGKKRLEGVMSRASQEAKERHFMQFLNWLNAHRTRGEGEFRLEKVK